MVHFVKVAKFICNKFMFIWKFISLYGSLGPCSPKLGSLMQNCESSEGERSQRNYFFVTLKISEHLKENKNIKTSDRNRNVRSRRIPGQKKGGKACTYISISAFHVE